MLKTKTNLDYWLTERYALFQDSKETMNKFEIHHIEWSIQELKIDLLQSTYPRFDKLISNTPDKTHYSKGVQVIAWDKEIISPNAD
ncbi:hypothetical protein F0000_20130 [Aquimarina sp. RZ0]|nr:hypothetical protein F0000_20130 [Aquimarina sp. RZ0]